MVRGSGVDTISDWAAMMSREQLVEEHVPHA